MPKQPPNKQTPRKSASQGDAATQQGIAQHDPNPSQNTAAGNNNDGSYESAVADRLAKRPARLGSPSVGNLVCGGSRNNRLASKPII